MSYTTIINEIKYDFHANETHTINSKDGPIIIKIDDKGNLSAKLKKNTAHCGLHEKFIITLTHSTAMVCPESRLRSAQVLFT